MNRDVKSDHRTAQAEGWRKVAVGDAKAWKARAEKAEAENERLREIVAELVDKMIGVRFEGFAARTVALQDAWHRANEMARAFDETEASR